MSRRLKKLGLMPEPREIVLGRGFFAVDSKLKVISSKALQEIGKYLKDELFALSGVRPKLSTDSNSDSKKIIFLRLEKNVLPKEGYRLEIDNHKVSITGGDGSGVFYGCQTLLQLIRKKRIPCISIVDYPEVSWRGMMVDVSRHFFTKEYVFKIIDILAMHKLNRLHLHLTDDQGWRIQIDSYPLLTEIGAWRMERGNRYGGFYSREDIKEIVDYAEKRFVEIIPEIDMPGHTQAVLAAYPELSCTKKNYAVKTDYGIPDEVLCVGQEKTYKFVEEVFREVAELFPSKYIHVGGDECPTVRWENCEACTQKLQEEGLKDYRDLQGYFEKRVNRILLNLGKTMIGWDEISGIEGLKDTVIMQWRQDVSLENLLKKEQKVIIGDSGYFYFNYPESQMELKLAGVSFNFHVYNTPAKKTYSYNFDNLGRKERGMILGLQGQIWTEYVETEERLEYMVLPRLCALAEVAWISGSLKDWRSFKARMKVHGKRLSKRNINYCRHTAFWEAAEE